MKKSLILQIALALKHPELFQKKELKKLMEIKNLICLISFLFSLINYFLIIPINSYTTLASLSTCLSTCGPPALTNFLN